LDVRNGNKIIERAYKVAILPKPILSMTLTEMMLAFLATPNWDEATLPAQ